MDPELVDIARNDWDVVVAGAGPAGSTAAGLLARRGLCVLLVDRAEFPRSKVCGCCLNGAALQALRAAGGSGTPRQWGAGPLNALELIGFGHRIPIPLPLGGVLSRSRLDEGLVSNARIEGARLLQRTIATLGAGDDEGWEIELHRKREADTCTVRARSVVCADGLDGGFLRRHSEFAPVISSNSRIGLGLQVPGHGSGPAAGRIRMVVDPDGYVGIVRLEDGRLDVAAAVDREALRNTGPAQLVSDILARNGALGGLAIDGSIRGTPALTRRHPARAGTRLFLLGDAAGYVEPFTGEGIAWAVSSALLAAPLVARACRDWDPRLVEEWEGLYRRSIGRRQSVIRCLAPILKRPLPSRAFLGVLRGLPFFARPVVTRLNKTVTER